MKDDIMEMLKRTKVTDDNYFGKQDGDTQYRYKHTPVEYVMENLEQYIIPECLDCCKIL